MGLTFILVKIFQIKNFYIKIILLLFKITLPFRKKKEKGQVPFQQPFQLHDKNVWPNGRNYRHIIFQKINADYSEYSEYFQIIGREF